MLIRDTLDKINALVNQLSKEDYIKVKPIIDVVMEDIIELYLDYYKLLNDSDQGVTKAGYFDDYSIPRDSQDEYEDLDDKNDTNNLDELNELDNTYYDEDDDKFVGNDYDENANDEDDFMYFGEEYSPDIWNTISANEPSRSYVVHRVLTSEVTSDTIINYVAKFILEDFLYNLTIDPIYNLKITKLDKLACNDASDIDIYSCRFNYLLKDSTNDNRDVYHLYDYYEFSKVGSTYKLTKPLHILGFKDVWCDVTNEDNWYVFRIYYAKYKEEE